MASRDCGVCLEQYDEGHRRPRCLNCGHTLCSACLAAALARDSGTLLCPFCRLPHPCPTSSPDDVPVNFAVVSLMQDVTRETATPRAQALLTEVKREANEFTTTQLMACNCHLMRLKDFQQRISATRSVQEEQVAKLRTLLSRHDDILKDLTSNDSRIADTLTRGYEQKASLEATQARINAASSLLEVTAAHEENRDYRDRLQEWNSEAQQLMQCQVMVGARQLERVTGAALQTAVEHNMAEINAALASPKLPTPSAPPMSECEDGGGDSTAQLLQDVTRRAAMMGSDVWGVTVAEGRPRCAKLTLHSNKLYLSALREGAPPRYTHTLPYDDLRGLVDETSLRVFLEMSWAGQTQGRVCIRLDNATPRTRQFFLLCSGERGPSYLDTRLLEVENRGLPGERVWGGDYENNDGSGGSALPGLTRGPLQSHSVMAGLVAGFCYGDDHHKPSHFVIYTGDFPVAYEECPLGRVEEGLAVVRAVAALPDVITATITDCGILGSLGASHHPLGKGTIPTRTR